MDCLIRDTIIHKIISGTYKWGTKLPSENRLADEYQVPRITVRKAFLTLADMGYIASKQGRGWFVRNQQMKIPLDLTGEISFSEKLINAGFELETHTITRKIDANNIYRIDRVRYVDRIPIALHISYLKQELFPKLESEGESITSLFSYFKSKGYYKFSSTKSLMSISLPTLEEQELLGCPPLVPLLVVESDTIDTASKKELQQTRILYRSDYFQYEIT